MGDVKCYVVTAAAQTLTEINELNNHLICTRFTLAPSNDAASSRFRYSQRWINQPAPQRDPGAGP